MFLAREDACAALLLRVSNVEAPLRESYKAVGEFVAVDAACSLDGVGARAEAAGVEAAGAPPEHVARVALEREREVDGCEPVTGEVASLVSLLPRPRSRSDAHPPHSHGGCGGCRAIRAWRVLARPLARLNRSDEVDAALRRGRRRLLRGDRRRRLLAVAAHDVRDVVQAHVRSRPAHREADALRDALREASRILPRSTQRVLLSLRYAPSRRSPSNAD